MDERTHITSDEGALLGKPSYANVGWDLKMKDKNPVSMRTIQIKVSETDFEKYNLESEKEMKFTDLVEKNKSWIRKKGPAWM